MNPATPTDREKESFAEAALRMGGKSEDEARRMGAVDKADEQVETLFASKYQTSNSPVHKAIWEGKIPLDLFATEMPTGSAPCDVAMEKSLQVMRRRREQRAIYDANGKV